MKSSPAARTLTVGRYITLTCTLVKPIYLERGIQTMRYEKIEQIGSHRQQCRGVYDLLREYARAGISLCLEGKEAEPGQIAATCLREGVSYMMDFIPENPDNQKITKIDFIKVDLDDVPNGRNGSPAPSNVAVLHCS